MPPKGFGPYTTPRRILLATAAVLALSSPAWAWDSYTAPAPTPSDPPASITNSPTGGSGGKGGHASATASATAGSASATGGMASATSSPSQRVVVRVDPTVSPAPAAATTPTRSATAAANPASDPADPSGARHRGAGTGATDPSGGRGNGGGNGGGFNGNNFPVATAYAPSYGAANPCIGQSASLGAQFQLFGLSAGGQQMDVECQMLRLGGQGDVVAARNLICIQSTQARQAYLEAGLPCPADRQKYAEAQQAVPVSAPAAPARPDYCAPGRGWTIAQLQARYQECR